MSYDVLRAVLSSADGHGEHGALWHTWHHNVCAESYRRNPQRPITLIGGRVSFVSTGAMNGLAKD